MYMKPDIQLCNVPEFSSHLIENVFINKNVLRMLFRQIITVYSWIRTCHTAVYVVNELFMPVTHAIIVIVL